jgi:hypothetical protein
MNPTANLLRGGREVRRLLLLIFVSVTNGAWGQTPMIYDDDGPVMNVAAVTNYGVFYKMVDNHWIEPLAIMAD